MGKGKNMIKNLQSLLIITCLASIFACYANPSEDAKMAAMHLRVFFLPEPSQSEQSRNHLIEPSLTMFNKDKSQIGSAFLGICDPNINDPNNIFVYICNTLSTKNPIDALMLCAKIHVWINNNNLSEQAVREFFILIKTILDAHEKMLHEKKQTSKRCCSKLWRCCKKTLKAPWIEKIITIIVQAAIQAATTRGSSQLTPQLKAILSQPNMEDIAYAVNDDKRLIKDPCEALNRLTYSWNFR